MLGWIRDMADLTPAACYDPPIKTKPGSIADVLFVRAGALDVGRSRHAVADGGCAVAYGTRFRLRSADDAGQPALANWLAAACDGEQNAIAYQPQTCLALAGDDAMTAAARPAAAAQVRLCTIFGMVVLVAGGMYWVQFSTRRRFTVS
jgi:hypothetical protein